MSQMRTKLALAAVASLISGTALAVPTVIQSASFASSTYHLLSESSWDDAEAAAQALGGHLTTVEDLAENTFLLNTFGPTAQALVTSGLLALWIGLNDATTEGSYQWASGSTSAYTNWLPGQPQNGVADEDYVGLLVDAGIPTGQWHDVVSDTRFNDRTFGVVEISAVPEPASWALVLSGLGVLSMVAKRKRHLRG